jgi:hypothetical protein
VLSLRPFGKSPDAAQTRGGVPDWNQISARPWRVQTAAQSPEQPRADRFPFRFGRDGERPSRRRPKRRPRRLVVRFWRCALRSERRRRSPPDGEHIWAAHSVVEAPGRRVIMYISRMPLHVQIWPKSHIAQRQRELYAFNLDEETLQERFVEPYEFAEPITWAGRTLDGGDITYRRTLLRARVSARSANRITWERPCSRSHATSGPGRF